MAENDERSAFLVIETMKDGLFVVDARTSEVVWRIRQSVTVHCQMVLSVHLAYYGFCTEFLQIGYGRGFVFFPEGFSRGESFRQWSVRVRRLYACKSAAFKNCPFEKTLCKRRDAKGIYADRSCALTGNRNV